MKSVWHISSNRWNSAITEYALSCVAASRLICDRVVFSPLAGSPAETRALQQGYEVMPFAGFSLGALRRFRQVWHDIRPDAIFVYGGPETTLTALGLKPSTCKVVRFRGQNFTDSAWFRWQQWLSQRNISALLTPSETLKTRLKPTTSRPVFCVPLGIDPARFSQISLAARSHQQPELLIFGRLDPVKGHARFIKIFSLLRKQWRVGPPPVLHIAGRSESLSREHLERAAIAAGLDLQRDVRFSLGDITNVAGLLSHAALGVVSSIGSEEICRVAQEFLLCGTPVFVSGVGALQEVLCFPGAGYSYGGMDDDEAACFLQNALREVLSEDDSVRGLRRSLAQEAFSIETMQQRLQAIL